MLPSGDIAKQGGHDLTCCGIAVCADEEEVQRLMTRQGLSADRQAREWLQMMHGYAEPEWMEVCVRNARRMANLVRDEREIMEMLGGSVEVAVAADGRTRPPDGLAQRHFEWLGERRHVTVEVVRDSIGALARGGYISPAADQQAAMRRGLGLTVNDLERQSRAPWVRWLGDADALNYLVESLWDEDLIHCPGGRRNKWTTLCGVFLRSDGSCFEPAIKGNRCRNDLKRKTIDDVVGVMLRYAS